MKFAPLPKNEIERLIVSKQYQILDSMAKESFDDITSLASQLCGTPIALITLLDESRQWFKCVHNLDGPGVAREISFCGHTVEGDDIFEVPNAAQDQRFMHNPLVTAHPDIRFYAGFPLITSDGYALGTLCVVDKVPRTLSSAQRVALKSWAGRWWCRSNIC